MMDETYRYLVYFECKCFYEEQKRRIEDYFSKLCGGDCGLLRKMDDKVYRVAFKHQKDQLRVLQKSEHVVELAEGSLVLIVRGSEEPHTASTIITTSSKSAIADLAKTPHSAHDRISPPSDEEYKFQPDTMLFRYLNESTKVWSELQSDFNAMSCSAQIYPKEGIVLVRSIAQPTASDNERNWKSGVDKLFDGYMCYYEVDPHKIKTLLQSSCSHVATDEVKVYSEDGIAVVVGKRSQVNARLADLEASTIKNQGSRSAEKQTSVCQLGEAKLYLLWNKINHSLGEDFPGLKVSQGDSGQLVLEGYVKEILDAIDCISDMQKLVLEKNVFDMGPHLMTFLRKAYGGPGVLANVLGACEEVVLELRDTHLCLFSVSADKLDDAEKALQSEFKEVELDVPKCSASPSELWQRLKSKTNEMNQEQCRVQAVFISDSTVCLLGHSKEVDELSEIVTQFVLDETYLEGTFPLPFSVSTQDLPELLEVHGFDYSGVAFRPLISSSEPRVVLEGPSKKVFEVRNRLCPFLDSLHQKNLLGYVGSSIQITDDSVLQYHNHTTAQHLTEGIMNVASYSLPDGLQVQVCQGDITRLEVDALVNAANEDLDHCGGVAAALSNAAGPEVQKESNTLVKQTGKISVGDVVVTTGGNLKCKKLLHAVGPKGGKAGGRERLLLVKTIRSALEMAEIMAFRSIAIPCISSDLSCVPVTVCSEAIVSAINEFGSQGGRILRKIILIDKKEEVVRALQKACVRIIQGKSTRNRTPRHLEMRMGAAVPAPAIEATAGPCEVGVHVETTKGTIETQKVLPFVQKRFQNRKFDGHFYKPVLNRRIILLGKTGVGKSSLANVIFGEEVFATYDSPNSGTKECQTETRLVGQRSITLIDTPGLFDTERSEEEMKPKILSCITDCSPGPHAFFILLKVDKFTEQEKEVIEKICRYFSEDVLKYAVVVFTHGEQLPKGMKIEDFVRQNPNLNDLVKKCGGRCHVVDNKYWNGKQQEDYRSNEYQVEELLNTVEKMVLENNEGYYTNEILRMVEEITKAEEELIKQSSGNMLAEEIRKQARKTVLSIFLIQLTGIGTGVLLGAFFGLKKMVRLVIETLRNNFKDVSKCISIITAASAAVGSEAAVVLGVGAGVVATAAAITAGVKGGVTGYEAAKRAETIKEAVKRAYKAVVEKRET